ncbi:MAG: sensor histidine kinase [Candidatus Levyibacteriota bacterium]
MKITKQDSLYFLITVFSLFAVFFIDSVLSTEIIVTSLYAIPIIISAYHFRGRVISLIATLTIVLYTYEAAVDRVSLLNICLYDLSLIIISLLVLQQSAQKLKSELHRKKSEMAEKQLEFFMNIIAHDLMQPITAIKIYATLPFQRTKADQEKIQKRLVSAVDTLEHLIYDLRDTASLRGGRFTLSPERTNLYSLLSEVVHEQQVGTESHHLQLSSPKHINGRWDRQRLKQVFTNLLSNAIKYSPKGGDISIEVKPQKENLLISVSDTGMGMTGRELTALFKPFSRIHKGKKEIRGTGLGLFISKSIIEAHHGKIWASGRKGRGSTFFVELPTR